MRRFLGLKSSNNSGTAQPLDSISNSNDLDNRKNNNTTKSTSTRSSSPGGPPPISKSPSKADRKSSKIGIVEGSERSVRSRHVQFDADEPTPTQILPTLAPQASFESRHGATGGLPCLPLKNGASSPESSQSPKLDIPGLPHAIIPHGKGGTNKETVTSVGLGLGLARTASPLSLASPSVGGSVASRGTPYSYGYNSHSSLARLSQRDPSQIYAPLTWSEMAHAELVGNVSARERTRQEILWEVVASEERYVAELRSLMSLYTLPLLHPRSPLSNAAPLPAAPAPAAYIQPSSIASTSRAELPIAQRFLRAVNGSSGNNETSTNTNGYRLNVDHREMPEIGGSESSTSNGLSRNTPTPSSPRTPVHPAAVSSASLPVPTSSNSPPQGRAGRLSSLTFRHPLRGPATGAKLHKSVKQAPPDALIPPTLPEALRLILEVIPQMLKGHEELSDRLREQWSKAFPLVRGLGEIWSDQPFFLLTYSAYILCLEEALSILDSCLPSPHSPNQPYSSKFKPKTPEDKHEKKLARYIMDLEEKAAEQGESGLAICLSKPLMRLGKLPLLMQNLLYHTDAAASFEYEKTRSMALEIDALVRSIEDEKIEEEEREKSRDLLARIEGINDKALMAPRSSRLVVQETSVWQPSSSSTQLPNASPGPPRRISDGYTQGLKPIDLSSGKQKSSRRLSDFVHNRSEEKAPKMGSKADLWFVHFSDVVLRCQRTGTTDIPGGFSRDKEKLGKQGKVKKRGKTRNLYRFLKVERWETRQLVDDQGVIIREELDRLRRGIPEESIMSAEIESDQSDAESQMSFTYEDDDPKPLAEIRNFKKSTRSLSTPTNASSRRVSTSTHSTVNRAGSADVKFGNRLRAGYDDHPTSRSPTPTYSHRFQTPTAATTSKSRQSTNPAPIYPRSVTPTPPLASSSTMPRLAPPSSSSSRVAVPPTTRHFSDLSRDDSVTGLYSAFWGEESQASSPNLSHSVPFPTSSAV